jgi:hypothetical protein
MIAVQPKCEQLTLPFEDEVLVVLYKREVDSRTLQEHWDALDFTVRVRAASLGFAVKCSRRDCWHEDGVLNIQLRAEAERI